jgi:hypothetical protein
MMSLAGTVRNSMRLNPHGTIQSPTGILVLIPKLLILVRTSIAVVALVIPGMLLMQLSAVSATKASKLL